MRKLEPCFLELSGQRFCMLHEPPQARTRGAVLYVHPFAEEMNNARRIAAVQSRALANAGWVVLQIDLYGCGDSPGTFGEASWEQWLEDVGSARRWLQARTGHEPLLWALRTGCLLAAASVATSSGPARFIFWQPVSAGRAFLQQFLRVEAARQMVSRSDTGATGVRGLRERLAHGSAVDVAGYRLSPALAAALEQARLELPAAPASVALFEISSTRALSPGAAATVAQWQGLGHRVDARVVGAPAFWQIPGVSACDELISATLETVQTWAS